jgi:hypothetical protein
MARAADQPQTATPLQSFRSLLSRFSTAQLLQIAAAVFIISTLLAVLQFREPYHWHKPYPSESLSWWLRPLEWNIDAGLPQISGDINAVAVNRSADCLWIGGDAGLLAFSNDAGRTWLQLAYDAGSGAFRTPLQQSIPCGGDRSATTAALEWPSITFVARAATVEPRKPGEQRGETSARCQRYAAELLATELAGTARRFSQSAGTGETQPGTATEYWSPVQLAFEIAITAPGPGHISDGFFEGPTCAHHRRPVGIRSDQPGRPVASRSTRTFQNRE